MNIEIKQVEPADKIKLRKLMQFYLYDFSEFLPLDLNDKASFNESVINDYFITPGKEPFLVLVDGKLGGFVLVSPEALLDENKGGKCIKEFFIMRRYRRMGVGRAVASKVFARHTGRWEVRVKRSNQPAKAFWEEVIEEYTGGNYRKEERDDEVWEGSILSFCVGPTAV